MAFDGDTTQWIDREIGPITVLFGASGGKYPHGNSLLVRGERETGVIDPSLGLVARGTPLPRADRIFLSHCHEDHIAGVHLYPEASCHIHEADRSGLQSLDAFMEIYGFPGPVEDGFREVATHQFHYRARPDAQAFDDGDVFDLGRVHIRVLHTPGHTRGHSCFLVEWGEESLLYLGDIDLSSFGPYYGDAWSDLEDFERSLERVREIKADFYATFHHIGVLESREAFLERLDRFAAVIRSREARLLDFLAAPKSLDEVAEHRFVYRPSDAIPFAEPVERRSMGMHIARLVRAGRVEALEGHLFRAR